MTKLVANIGGKIIEHGCLYEIANSNKTPHTEHMSGKAKAEYEKRQKEEEKIVRARFIIGNKRELWNDIGHCVGPGKPLCQYRFLDGHVYEIPKGLVQKVNREGVRVKRADRVLPSGQVAENEERIVHREFVPVNFD